MSLLYSLFPSLEKDNHGNEIPTWPDKNKPWNIISVSGEESLSKQIMSLKLTYPKRIENSNCCLDDTGGPIYIHPTAEIGEFVKIEGPTYIGKNVKIRHSAYLRKGSWICNNAVVGHSSEIKNSILLPGAKAPHFNYIGDSILGFNVNIGAGAKISNVRNDKRNVLISLKDGKKIDSKLKKFGALIGDNSEIGCNVVSNPGTIIEPGTMINPNNSIKGWVTSMS